MHRHGGELAIALAGPPDFPSEIHSPDPLALQGGSQGGQRPVDAVVDGLRVGPAERPGDIGRGLTVHDEELEGQSGVGFELLERLREARRRLGRCRAGIRVLRRLGSSRGGGARYRSTPFAPEASAAL